MLSSSSLNSIILRFYVYILVDLVKRGVLTLVVSGTGLHRYRNDCYYYYCYYSSSGGGGGGGGVGGGGGGGGGGSSSSISCSEKNNIFTVMECLIPKYSP